MRELNDDDIKIQVETLQGYVARGGLPEVWLASKSFTREDAYEVRLAYRKLTQERQGQSA